MRILDTVNEEISLNGLHKVLAYADVLVIIAYRKEGLDRVQD